MDFNEEQKLVSRLIEGQEDAFCTLYANYKERLFYFALKFVKSKDFAEDIFQDVFTAVWKNRSFINPNEPFSSFVYTIARNRILNLLRDLSYEDDLKEHILSNAIDFDEETHEMVVADDLKSIVNKAIEGLTPRQKEVFQMSREGEMSYKEIADQLGLSVYTVQEYIASSLKSIRSYLSKYGDMSASVILLFIVLNSFHS
jgi:RNA polymerase sigma-70 factor (ECF subfamily)